MFLRTFPIDFSQMDQMEVIVTIVSKLVNLTYLQDLNNTLI